MSTQKLTENPVYKASDVGFLSVLQCGADRLSATARRGVVFPRRLVIFDSPAESNPQSAKKRCLARIDKMKSVLPST